MRSSISPRFTLIHAWLRLVALTAKTEKAKKNGLSSPFLIFTAEAIIAKIRADLKGVALCRQIARPAAQIRPTGAVRALAPDDAVPGRKRSRPGEEWEPGRRRGWLLSSATTLRGCAEDGLPRSAKAGGFIWRQDSSKADRRRIDGHTCLRGAPRGMLLAAACAQEVAKAPLPATPPEDRASAPVVRRPLPETPIPTPPEARPGIPVPAPEAAIVLPPNAQYVCVTDAAGQRQQMVIEFSAPKVAAMCVKHPEMGPCQYERNACRRSGGRVFAAGGKEITMATEAEYDKKVMRIRLKSN